MTQRTVKVCLNFARFFVLSQHLLDFQQALISISNSFKSAYLLKPRVAFSPGVAHPADITRNQHTRPLSGCKVLSPPRAALTAPAETPPSSAPSCSAQPGHGIDRVRPGLCLSVLFSGICIALGEVTPPWLRSLPCPCALCGWKKQVAGFGSTLPRRLPISAGAQPSLPFARASSCKPG